MDDQIGITANWRCEMRVFVQIQTKMADIVRAVDRLTLCAQHNLIDQFLMISTFNSFENTIELARSEFSTLCEVHIKRAEKLTQAFLLCECRRIVNTEDQRLATCFKHFSRGHIGLNHELFDELMRIKPFRHDDLIDLAVRCQQNFLFWKVQLERFTGIATTLQCCIGVPQRLENGIEYRCGLIVGRTVNRCLCLRIGQFCSRTHQNAVELVRLLVTVGIEHHTHCKCRAIFQFTQRAEIVGNAFWQHRYNPVGEVDRIAAFQCFTIECGIRAHIGCNIGNSDDNDMSAGIIRVRIGLCIDRVVMILGICRIDGDEWNLTPVFPTVQRCRLGAFRFADHIIRENMRDFMFMDRNHRQRFFTVYGTDHLTHLACWQAVAA
ncbi:hypothetical protein D3C80_508500 [compost metagenome]